MILAAIAVPALSWWGSWRYQAAKAAEAEAAARAEVERKQIASKRQIAEWIEHPERVQDVFAEWKRSSEALSKRVVELEKVFQSAVNGENKKDPTYDNDIIASDKRQVAELKKKQEELDAIRRELMELKRKQEDLRRRQTAVSFEVSPVIRRTSWNGQTDPDSVWHDQRRDANRTLIQHGLPTLEGRGAFPDSAPMTRFLPPSMDLQK